MLSPFLLDFLLMSKVINLYKLDMVALTDLLVEMGERPFRARQIWEWIYRAFADDVQQMTNLPQRLRDELAARTTLSIGEIVATQYSRDGQTEKILIRLSNNQYTYAPISQPPNLMLSQSPDLQSPVSNLYIETVLMRYARRRTLCISTQAGCAMGCVFCATGQMGFARHLSVAEIVGQVMVYARRLAAEGDHVTNIVMMGMGEPLHNYTNTLGAIDRLTDPTGFNLGARKITISTVGLVPAIRRYADEQRQTPLAVSLHAATDEERDRLIPANRRWPIAELLDACRYYIEKTGRRMTFEWALIAYENDTEEQAHALGRLLQGMLCHVNLIPLNPTAGYGGVPSSPERVERFRQVLAQYGVSSTVRVRRGIDIQAGCGQLRDRVVSGTQ
jgi:23S rRNA (adenine2503-C2)-methyltransferase